jgi:hypothetical protein
MIIVEEAMTKFLSRVNEISKYRCSPLRGVHPAVCAADCQLMTILEPPCPGKVASDGMDVFLNRHVVDRPLQERIIRKLAFRAGIVKLSNDAYDPLWGKLMHYLELVISKVIPQVEHVMRSEESWSPPPSPIGVEVVAISNKPGGNLHLRRKIEKCVDMRKVPPSNWCFGPGNGTKKHVYICGLMVPVPAQVQHAASLLGLEAPAVHGDPWLVREGSTEADERAEALRYYDPHQLCDIARDLGLPHRVWQEDGGDQGNKYGNELDMSVSSDDSVMDVSSDESDFSEYEDD